MDIFELNASDMVALNEIAELNTMMLNESKDSQWKKIKDSLHVIRFNENDIRDPKRFTTRVKKVLDKFAKHFYADPDDGMAKRVVKYIFSAIAILEITRIENLLPTVGSVILLGPILGSILALVTYFIILIANCKKYNEVTAEYYIKYFYAKAKYCDERARKADSKELRDYWIGVKKQLERSAGDMVKHYKIKLEESEDLGLSFYMGDTLEESFTNYLDDFYEIY